MLAVTGYPLGYAVWLSLQRYDLDTPGQRRWVWLDNYAAVLGAAVFRADLLVTVVVTVVSVAVEVAVGLAVALVLHRATIGRRTLRTSVLVPYGVVSVAAAIAWRYAVHPDVSAVTDRDWLAQQWSAVAVVIGTEVWKATPFVALLLLAGLATVPEELYEAARVDGATGWQRWSRVTLPNLRPAILVAVLFRTLDTFRVFDPVFVLTGGANGTETLSVAGYDRLVNRLDLGLGSAFAVVLFGLAGLLAAGFGRRFAAELGPARDGRR